MTAPCRLSLKRVYEAARTVDSVFLHTPQFVFEPLREALGVRTTLKIETLNPARSFKGRGADFLVSALKDMQPTPQLGYASAGNFGQAVAYAARKHRLPLTVYTAANANALKVARTRLLGATVCLGR